MIDNETPKSGNPTERLEAKAGTTPNAVRRKLARAALSAPVLMTLGPRAVMGQTAMRCMASVMNSVAADGASASPQALEAVQECEASIDEYKAAAAAEQAECPDADLPDATDEEAFSVSEVTEVDEELQLLEKHTCPIDDTVPPPENLPDSTSQDCIADPGTTPVTAPQPVITEPNARQSRRLRDDIRGGKASEPSSSQASAVQPSEYTRPSRYTSSTRPTGRDSQRSSRRRDATTTAAPEVAATPAPQALGCNSQPAATGLEPTTAAETTSKMSRRGLRESLRNDRVRDR
jgi:hypothetical protein